MKYNILIDGKTEGKTEGLGITLSDAKVKLQVVKENNIKNEVLKGVLTFFISAAIGLFSAFVYMWAFETVQNLFIEYIPWEPLAKESLIPLSLIATLLLPTTGNSSNAETTNTKILIRVFAIRIILPLLTVLSAHILKAIYI